ncbi:TetR/AcrR family transcriptional regulator C-terminal domain-containing protein [Streptomyces racemochromogenes]|uniref:TetR/AcrR family transcriptional regulator C-terminal domain-containing protein n=1 Tax=Streptomyces racemochromogenes TaxID=67353 RepID=A0ABW7PGH7_9ACTN
MDAVLAAAKDGRVVADGQWGAAVRLLWGPPVTPARGPRRGLTLEQIAEAGVGIADADGLGGVSMQGVAGELGVTKMALYRYVPGKAELVALMVEAALPDPAEGLDAALARARGGWREALGVWARELLSGYRAHPWLLDATVGARALGPTEVGWLERALAALAGCGLTGAEAMDVVVLVTGHVRGIAGQERASGGGAGGVDAELGAVLAQVVRERGEAYPALTVALGSLAEHGGQDQGLEFGLERILDGVGMLVERRGGG